MASFVVKVLSVTLGLFFIFVGLLKLSPAINKELYKEMRKQFIRMAKVFPLVSWTGWKPNAHIYRKIIASTEVTCGAILVLIPGPLKIAANIVMILINANDVIAHSQIKDGLQRMSLPIVFILLLSCRLLIYYQETQREKKLLEEKQKQNDGNVSEQQTAEETSPEEKKTQ
ncbi:novel acetylcholine receptor chaperone-like [Mercenaria mercenaria]|uniref:novel acetylcholine receptor chaperone-like n=1 Tax=Mercenaria mercenaria TaxID=6596 RepID=UPI00234FB208|nr:novel acetylcholine receptor chaperone-like [Mercenaria mercenaria]